MLMTEKYQTTKQRCFASSIDALVFFPLGLLDEQILVRTNPLWLLIVWTLFTYTVVWLYSVLLHYYFGQTLGKKLLDVKVLDHKTEGKIMLRQALLRDIGAIIFNTLSMLLVLYGLFVPEAVESPSFQTMRVALMYAILGWGVLEIVTCLFNEKRRAIHDFIAGTVVVRVGSGAQNRSLR